MANEIDEKEERGLRAMLKVMAIAAVTLAIIISVFGSAQRPVEPGSAAVVAPRDPVDDDLTFIGTDSNLDLIDATGWTFSMPDRIMFESEGDPAIAWTLCWTNPDARQWKPTDDLTIVRGERGGCTWEVQKVQP